jgi:hypothetical protein
MLRYRPSADVPANFRLGADPLKSVSIPAPSKRLSIDNGIVLMEAAMKYVCLVYAEEKKLDAISDGEWHDYCEALRAGGRQLAAEALQPAQAATTVRVRNGRLAISAGPAVEAQEPLAGFYLIDARDLNDAIRTVGRIPSARVGSVEIRPVRVLARPVAENK